MTVERRGCRPTLLTLMISIAGFAMAFSVFILPALRLKFGPQQDITYPGSILVPRPFWPQYWRAVRGVPEPDKVPRSMPSPDQYREIYRSDDGGIIAEAIGCGVMLVLFGIPFVRKHREWFFR